MSRLRNIPGSRDVIAASEFVIRDAEEKRGNWPEIFDHKALPEIEIGMGKGRFLMDMAERYPDRNFVGIEMQSSVLFRAIQKAEVRAMKKTAPEGSSDPAVIPASVTDGRPGVWKGCNFRFLLMDARKLTDVFAPGEVGWIYLNFSDPWPKERHGNRRLTAPGFLRMYREILADGGGVTFKTDNRELFDFSLAAVQEEHYHLEAVSRDLHADEALCRDNVMTEYEEKFSAKGNPICMLKARP